METLQGTVRKNEGRDLETGEIVDEEMTPEIEIGDPDEDLGRGQEAGTMIGIEEGHDQGPEIADQDGIENQEIEVIVDVETHVTTTVAVLHDETEKIEIDENPIPMIASHIPQVTEIKSKCQNLRQEEKTEKEATLNMVMETMMYSQYTASTPTLRDQSKTAATKSTGHHNE